MQESGDKIKLQKLGTYHLGELYNLDDFLQSESLYVFQAGELVQDKQEQSKYIVITEANIVSCQLVDAKKSTVRLSSWSHLQNLMNIKRKKDEANTIILTWKATDKQKDGTTQVLFVREADKFIEIVIKNMKSYGVKVQKNIVKQPDLAPEDVSLEALGKIDIQKVLETIAANETKLENELNIAIIDSLMANYQKVTRLLHRDRGTE